ncbi:MAG: peptidoglycan DD-metalloendopeptidase family protein [Candidatus Omnitrophica bacterium]|nr:peptidoglycan DD-metalloendopeptidase family protein [Candidatus Omnitrophota bacterium]
MALVLCLNGCATAPKSLSKVNSSTMNSLSTIGTTGFYHTVSRGQTLWRIANLYGVSIEELVSANNLYDFTKIEVGQKIFIPRSKSPGNMYPLTEEFIWPLRGRLIASFGQKWKEETIKGILIAPVNNKEVMAARSGRVVFCNQNFLDLGKTIIIEHPGGFWTIYGRLSEVFVQPGAQVNRGVVIAKVGNTTQDEKVFLHFQLRKGIQAQNPLFYLP